jgi:hypothetical protein
LDASAIVGGLCHAAERRSVRRQGLELLIAPDSIALLLLSLPFVVAITTYAAVHRTYGGLLAPVVVAVVALLLTAIVALAVGLLLLG